MDKRIAWARDLLNREGQEAAKLRDLQQDLVSKFEAQEEAASNYEAQKMAAENRDHHDTLLWQHRKRLAAVSLMRNLLDAYENNREPSN